MIKALAARYPQREAIEDMSPWDKAYTSEMRKIFAAFPDDLEVRAVLAESIMNETPWQMWDLPSGKPAEGAGTEECRALLEQALDRIPAAWDHPGLLHLYVHLMDMSPFPQRALRAGDRLREIVPDSGHLIHMPTHLDVLCGHYRDVLVYNQKALETDRKFLAYSDDPGVYLVYVIHNFHFAIYGAMFLGQYTPAIAAAEELIATIPEAVLRIQSPPMADFLEGYLTMKQHVLVRFGKWHEIIAQELPEDQDLYCSNVAMIHYAKAVAHSALGNVAEAEAEKALFMAAKARVPESRRVHNNLVVHLLVSPKRCSTANWNIGRATMTRPSRTCASRSNSATGCPMTSRGDDGCSRPAMRWEPFSSSRDASRKPRRCTAPISALTAS